jgi:hypothetical protein
MITKEWTEQSGRHCREAWALIKSVRPTREARAREALEIAVRAGVPRSDIDKVMTELGLPALFAWHLMTDNQLAAYSARLRVLAGFY